MSDVIGPATERMIDFPFAQGYRQEVLEQARVFYERLLQQAEGDPELRRELAQIHRRLGQLGLEQRRQDAEPAFRRSLAILEDLAQGVSRTTRTIARTRAGRTLGCALWYAADLRLEEALRAEPDLARHHARSRGGVSRQRPVSPIAAQHATTSWAGA